MRPVVIVVSTAAHLAVLWWIADTPRPARRPVPSRPPSVVAVGDVIPIEIAFVPEATAAPPTSRGGGGGGGGGARRGRGRIATATAGVAPRSEDGGTLPSSTTSGSSLMQMHRGANLRLDPATAERIASAAGTASPHDEVRSSGRLESQPGGRAVVHDTVTDVDVDADGHVTFHDKPDVEAKARAPLGPLFDPRFRREVRDHLAKWLEDPSEGMRYGPTADLPAHLQAVPQACDAWGSDWCEDPNAPDFEKRLRSIKQQLRGGVSGKLDLTAMVHRKVAGDPYASRKRKLLDETRDERIEMSRRYRAQQDARSAELMRRNLERLWIDELDPRARREALFELWNECSDDDAGKRARSIVIGWIRARLPRGSEHSFTDDEIVTFRARSSSARSFDPYDQRAVE